MNDALATGSVPAHGTRPESTRLSYQEMLRTLGTVLELMDLSRTIITLSREGAEVIAPGWRAPRVWSAHALRLEAAAQRRWRVARVHPALQPRGLAQRLRAVGTALDRVRGSDLYVLVVDAHRVDVHGRGYERSFHGHQLARRLTLATYLRGQLPARGMSRPAPTELATTEPACLVS